MSCVIDLSGQTAWVTGGGSGIGRAIVSVLSDAGARVVSLDLQHSGGAGDADRVVVEALDVRDSSAVAAMAASLDSRGLAPDALVNCAGITRDNVVWKLTDEDWQDVLDVNLGGVFRMTRACAPIMRRRLHGAVVNIASINALRGKVGQANYAASKGGLVSFTRTVARELARFHVRVNAVAPGFIDTPMTKALPEAVLARARAEALLGQLGRPEDIAHAVLFLVSPLASHITGHVLVVDGGQTV
jgi:NAD(P)-dependent dehydrogenase (short-subunit alcohol dehydrogenase family)